MKETYYIPYPALYNSGGIGKELILDCDDSWVVNPICYADNDVPL